MKLFTLSCLAISMALNVPAVANAQRGEIKFAHLSLEEGLSQIAVYSILQDHKGFLWFGTKDGLNKYDGYNFIVYKNNPYDPSSLSDNLIQALCVDQRGALWVGTRRGLNKLDLTTERLTRYLSDPNNPHSLSHNYIWTLLADRSGAIWVGTDGGGLSRLDPQTDRFTRYQHDPNDPNSLSHNQIQALWEDQVGLVWIGTFAGLNSFDPLRKKFTRYQHDPADPNSLSHDSVLKIYEDRSGILWIGTRGGGLDRFDRQTKKFSHYQHEPGNPASLSDNRVSAIWEDFSGVLWIGTMGGGLNRFDRQTGEFIRYRHDPANPHSLSHEAIWSIYQERSGTLWIGTVGAGLNKFVRRTKQFHTYSAIPHDPESLSNNFIRAIFADHRGVLWVGTYGGGLNRLDRQTGTFKHFKNDPANPRSLSHNVVWSIYEDRQGTLWIGTRNGLDRFDRPTETFIHFQHDPEIANSLSDNDVGVIYEDRAGMLWIGTYNGGLNRFDRRTSTCKRFQHDPGNPRSLSHNSILAIFEDQTGALWIGTDGGGLNKLDREAETFIHYKSDPNRPHSLSHNTVRCLYEDQLGTLWIGTSQGLHRFDRRTEMFTPYFEKDGLPNEVIYGILGDQQGNLWFSTNKGIVKFDDRLPATHKFQHYDVSDGLQSNEFNTGAYHQSLSGEMFFGGVNGFTAFHPEQIKNNPYPPPVVLTAFRKFDRAASLDTVIAEITHLELSHEENFFAFEFAALDYSAPEKNRYAYKLEGFDQDWIDAGTRRYASYTNLDGGEYTFRVKASNNDGVWNEKGASIKIRIIPPFWVTWWFRVLAALAIAGFLLLLYNYRIKKLREIELVRARIAADLHDEIASSLASVRLYAEVIQLQMPEAPEHIQQILQRIRAISRDVTDGISHIIWSIDPRHDQLSELLNYFQRQASPLCTAAGVLLQTHWPEHLKPLSLSPEQRRTIYLILKEGLTNTLRHAQSTRVDFNCLVEDRFLSLVLRDNGRGFVQDDNSGGHGLANMRKRAEAIGAQLDITSQPGTGTALRLRLKMT